jgi:hypothetical protein
MDPETPFTPHELYREVQRMRTQIEVYGDVIDMARVQLDTLGRALDRVSQALEKALELPATQALEVELARGGENTAVVATDGDATTTATAVKQAPPLDMEQWLQGYVKAVLGKADRALTNTEIRRQLHTVVEQQQYCAPNKAMVNRTLHQMGDAGTLWCEKRGGYCYWSLCSGGEKKKTKKAKSGNK